jgi:TolA-binding protein
LIDKPTDTVSKPTAQLALADFYEAQQKPDEAKRVYEQVTKDNPSTEAANLAKQRVEEMK